MPARVGFAEQNCSIAQAIEVLGDGWTLMILREAFLGTRRFAEFQRALGISKNVLSGRLTQLVEHGVLAQVDAGRHGTRYEYALTAKGKDLATVLTALRQWADRWVYGEGREPLLVVDRRTGEPIPRLRILDASGAPVRDRDLELRAGPGASPATRERLARRGSG
ncbi:MAG: helix-turn-helix transcriptional regulator [Myxococcales bacterium]|nr:helix-turn-helix transcriptional regulator [Myxococcales bacterium]